MLTKTLAAGGLRVKPLSEKIIPARALTLPKGAATLVAGLASGGRVRKAAYMIRFAALHERQAAAKTQAQVCEDAARHGHEMSTRTLRALERGEREWHTGNIDAVCAGIGIEPVALLKRAAQMGE